MSSGLTEIQKLGLAFGALYSEVYGLKHDSLRGVSSAVDDEFKQYICEIFESCWGIQNREDLIQSLEWRFRYGDRGEYSEEDGDADDLLAWDFCLLIHNARFGFLAGMLSEAETWAWVIKSAEAMEHKFSSWNAFADSFRKGRCFWDAVNCLNDERDEYDDAIETLLDASNKNSPWNHIKLIGEKKDKRTPQQKFTPAQWVTIVQNNPSVGSGSMKKKAHKR